MSNELFSSMDFKPVRKRPIVYRMVRNNPINDMPPFTYRHNSVDGLRVETYTADGRLETTNTANSGDVIMCGPSKEKYVLSASKFNKMYTMVDVGGIVIPEQSPRLVCEYTNDDEISFMAPWGENMILTKGDFLVKESETAYYRIGREEFQKTYQI
jgi:hypothetical protein